MSATLSQISDWLTNNLPQIVALIFSSSFGIYLFKFLCNLITLKIQNKTKDKFSQPILTKIDELENKFIQTTENVEQLINKNNETFDEKIKLAFGEEAKKKADAYEKIMSQPLNVKIDKEVIKQVKEELKKEIQPVIEEEQKEENVEESEFTVVERVIANE
jgi:uncharacterized protein (DUF2267 family)